MGFNKPLRYVIANMKPIHCPCGTKICDDCRALETKGKLYCLLEIYDDSAARGLPGFSLLEAGKYIWYPYKLMKTFDNKADAEKYAKKNKVEFVKPE